MALGSSLASRLEQSVMSMQENHTLRRKETVFQTHKTEKSHFSYNSVRSLFHFPCFCCTFVGFFFLQEWINNKTKLADKEY